MGMRIRNTEIWTVADVNKVQVLVFTPGSTGLSLLDVEGKRFTRYKFHSCSVSFKATASTTTAGEVVWGIGPGAKLEEIKTKEDIMKLRPFEIGAIWKSTGTTVGRNITPQPYLYCSDNTRDGVAFCIYAYVGADKVSGVFQLTYDVEFSYPNP